MLFDADMEFRLALFDHIEKLRVLYGGVIPSAALDEGMTYKGERRPIWNKPRGIYRPAHLKFPGAAVTVVTSPNSPYDDHVDPELSRLIYKYQRAGPSHPDNAAVRRAMELGRPLLYLIGLKKGVYDAVYPCYVVEDDPSTQSFQLMVDVRVEPAQLEGADPGLFEARRAYRTVAAKMRVHQQKFRIMVLDAYSEQCAMCRLRHTPLLDAAHILPDNHPDGRPVLPNGLSLCKIHHSAYDVGILGVDPDYRIHLRRDVLEEHDGPMLRHGLQEIHGSLIHTPRSAAKRPDREFLSWRFQKFVAA